MRRYRWLIASVLIVLVAGAIYGLQQFDKANFGVPRFFLWRMVSHDFHGGNRADVNGVSLYYESYGQGPPVLLVHGAAAFLETMHPFITALASTHTVIAVDSRAQGRSTDSAAPLSYAQMGDDMIKLLDKLGIAQIDVIGWSDGGIVGLDMAMRHPSRVRRLVAISANFDANGVAPNALGPQAQAEIAAEIKPFYDAIAPDPSHFPVMVRKIMVMVTTEPHYTIAELGRIKARTLIVAGENDLILRRHTDALAHAIPGAKEIIVPGATHLGPLDAPETYTKIARDFLAAP
ncbi:MAG TPA: alpha/beta hydrolase [Rhizomicrobium sp.]